MSQSGGAQFTPGPWNAYNVHKGRILKHWQVDTGTGKVMLDDAAQWEAGNAALIAAAPAMYEALETVPLPKHNEAVGEFYTRFYAWYEGQRKQALAQAEGRKG